MIIKSCLNVGHREIKQKSIIVLGFCNTSPSPELVHCISCAGYYLFHDTFPGVGMREKKHYLSFLRTKTALYLMSLFLCGIFLQKTGSLRSLREPVTEKYTFTNYNLWEDESLLWEKIIIANLHRHHCHPWWAWMVPFLRGLVPLSSSPLQREWSSRGTHSVFYLNYCIFRPIWCTY